MYTLGINTASFQTSVAILENDKLLAEKSWPYHADEAENLLNQINKLCQKNKIPLKKLSRLFVVSGPGSYTSIRIGITIANSLAYALKLPIFSLDLFKFYQLNFSLKKSPPIIIYAGRGEVYYQSSTTSPITIMNPESLIEKLKQKGKNIQLLSELNNEFQETLQKLLPSNIKIITASSLLSFGKLMEKIDYSKLKPEKTVKPFYLRAPDITVAKKKQVRQTQGLNFDF